MKKGFILFLSLFSILSCKKSSEKFVTNNSCSNIKLDSMIVKNYYQDAAESYLTEIYSDSTHKNYNDPVLDKNNINENLSLIQAVYNSTSAERDTVFNIYKIHTQICNLSNSISIAAVVNAPEIKNWVKGIIPTGNSELDKIITNYKFDSVSFSSYYPTSTSFFTIYTPETYNLLPIIKQFKSIPSIFSAEINSFCTDGNYIAIVRNSADSSIINFSLGWGDCPSGCIERRSWIFKIKCGNANFYKAISR